MRVSPSCHSRESGNPVLVAPAQAGACRTYWRKTHEEAPVFTGATELIVAHGRLAGYASSVRKDYEHLTSQQKRQVERAVVILREEFQKAIQNKMSPKRRGGRILKIILYGSMARGKPVRDLNTGYRSDFDLLAVVDREALADDDLWYPARDALDLEASLGATRYPYNLVVHDLADVNDQLHRGRPFFVDIDRDGIVLYEYDTKELAKPGNLSAEEIREEAQGYFDQWFKSSLELAAGARFYTQRGSFNEAAFSLHQAVEKAYHCLLLTLTLYSPKLHNIKILRSRAEGLDLRLIEAWPRKTRHQRRAFSHLQRAYVESRYSKHDRITKELLNEATASVEQLQTIVKTVCEERLTKP